MNATAKPATSEGFWVAVCVVLFATISLVFLLPLVVPVPFRAAISASYVAGFDNGVAAIAAASIGAAVLCWSWWRHGRQAATPTTERRGAELRGAELQDTKLGPGITSAAILATAVFCFCSWWLLAHSHLRYLADAGYFLEQMSSHVESGRALYSGVEFAYGPLLFYPTVVLHSFGCSWLPAYFITLAIEQAAGILCAVYLLNAWPIGGGDRRCGLLLLAVGALNPLLGLNYTLFRFLSGFAALVFAARRKHLATAMLAVAVSEIVLLGISAEQGTAFLVATFALAGLRTRTAGWRWLGVAAGSMAGASIFAFTVGRPYFHMLGSFSRGALNLPVAPYPHIVVFLLAVLWVVPYALGSLLHSDAICGEELTVSYVLGLGLLPAALGRCDPLHVFLNGAGILLLSLTAIRHQSRARRLSWLLLLTCWMGWQQGVNNALFGRRTADTLRLAAMPQLSAGAQDRVVRMVGRLDPGLAVHLRPGPADAEYQLNVDAIEDLTGDAKIATPLEIPPTVEAALKNTGHYRYAYYAFGVDTFDRAAAERSLADLNGAEWALLPTDVPRPFIEMPQDLGALQGFVFPYKARHAIPFDPGSLFNDNLQRHWEKRLQVGPYTLFQHRDAP